MKRARALLILLLALILPVQGMAAAFAPVHRAMNADTVAAMPCHEPPGAHRAPAQDGAVPAQDGDIAPHACCHQVFSGAPATFTPATARKFSDVSRFVLPLATLYIPDSPDRPPRG